VTAADDAGPTGFSTAIRREGSRAVVVLVGELDLHTAQQLTATVSHVLREEVDRVELDAGGLTFADSAGLRAVLVARAAAEEAGATFGVTDASGPVERLIDITGLSELLVDESQA
jgi:anti-sigma B factor antagonist